MAIVDLDAALGKSERILLDSSALIAFHNRQEPAHLLARHLLGRIERDDEPLQGYYSVVSAAELLIRPLRAGSAPFSFMHTFLLSFPNLTALPIDLSVATEAATIRAATGLRLPDALVAASAILAGCQAIISNDGQWQRRLAPLFPEFRWIYLSDYLDT